MASDAGPGAPAENGAAYRPGYEVVAEQILKLIAERQLQPGDRMPTENELASSLGASRSVVREAVKILSAIGRVSVQKGRGLYVADDEGMLGSSPWGGSFMPTDLDQIFMLFEFRRVQETATSRLAATRATPAELRVIKEAMDLCREGHETGRDALFGQGDDAFHLGIAEASHNPFLVAAVHEARRLQRQSHTIGMHGAVGDHARDAVAEHAAIYGAISAGDPDAAAEAAGVHLDKTLEDYRREIQRRIFGSGPTESR
ncbi:FadR/GntR family transcriptional regulator [Streptomyces graminilatus]|uniref:FadR/GntR family transcriptional regulator n=1 Tax=Streptomyces graminilatus TaxID=1464070 RepID=UPI0006E3F32B|nr:FadR/GntR family transcriptional regulator [Streptomyces graminilatus]